MSVRTDSRWRLASRSTIAKVLATNPRPANGDEFAALWRLVSKAYPWGERKMHPYKMWSMEVAIAKDRLARECFPDSRVHSAYRVRCPLCHSGVGIECKAVGTLQDDHMVADDAEKEGRLADAEMIRDRLFHDARLAKVGLSTADNETLPLFGAKP